VSPDGGAGWDEPPLDIQVPDDARELERDVLAYHRELRAKRRRRRLRRLASPFAGQGTIMPLLASILAVCLVAGAMLSVATFSPSTAPAGHHYQPPTATAPGPRSASGSPSASSAQRASAGSTVGASGSASAGTRGPISSARAASPSAKSNPSSTASHVRPPGGP
jgi:hypothetical protein